MRSSIESHNHLFTTAAGVTPWGHPPPLTPSVTPKQSPRPTARLPVDVVNTYTFLVLPVYEPILRNWLSSKCRKHSRLLNTFSLSKSLCLDTLQSAYLLAIWINDCTHCKMQQSIASSLCCVWLPQTVKIQLQPWGSQPHVWLGESRVQVGLGPAKAGQPGDKRARWN